jgi:hypothetical protein
MVFFFADVPYRDRRFELYTHDGFLAARDFTHTDWRVTHAEGGPVSPLELLPGQILVVRYLSKGLSGWFNLRRIQ